MGVAGAGDQKTPHGACKGGGSLDFARTLSRIVEDMSEALTIADAAKASGLSAHTLRYYERAGLLNSVDRNGSGHRRYRDEDLERIRFLTKLRSTGMPIREVRRYAELMRQGDGTDAERLALLEAHRESVFARLEETARNLDLIDWKINFYRQRLERK
jgi:DNA-binding transcriptional MerR regulator